MKDYSPKPLIEYHYHIKELIESQEKRSDERNYFREKGKVSEERNDLIKDAKIIVATDFWCNLCEEDFKSMAIKEIEIDWSCPSQFIAFYRSKCSKGHWCMRFITDRHKDGFWTRSKLCALDRGNHSLDTLQPHEIGFNMLYKKL